MFFNVVYIGYRDIIFLGPYKSKKARPLADLQGQPGGTIDHFASRPHVTRPFGRSLPDAVISVWDEFECVGKPRFSVFQCMCPCPQRTSRRQITRLSTVSPWMQRSIGGLTFFKLLYDS